jgi:hypothetical protein
MLSNLKVIFKCSAVFAALAFAGCSSGFDVGAGPNLTSNRHEGSSESEYPFKANRECTVKFVAGNFLVYSGGEFVTGFHYDLNLAASKATEQYNKMIRRGECVMPKQMPICSFSFAEGKFVLFIGKDSIVEFRHETDRSVTQALELRDLLVAGGVCLGANPSKIE